VTSTAAGPTASTGSEGRPGREMHAFIERLYPICRSITGDGVRRTLSAISELLPLDVVEVPTGTPAFDWEVPREWNIRDAWIADDTGRRVVDFRQSNLHVVGYSVPVNRKMSLEELRPHLHTLPDRPEVTPFRTSYFDESWGFCLPDRRLRELPDGEYEVVIDSSLTDGHLTYGEVVLDGESEEEFLVSTHVCHPSLGNDNLSGIAVATWLARALSQLRRRFTYRFLFVPGLIGPIVWLSRNEERVGRIRHGLVLACIGDPGHPTYKRTRRGNADIDRAVEHVLRDSGQQYRIREFAPLGYDERQFNSPGFDLPVGLLMRSPHGEYPEYHTSADDLSVVRPESLADSLAKLLSVVDVLEHDRRYVNLSPKGEPQLGRRGLYRTIGGGGFRDLEPALLWVLNLSDGKSSLLDVAERSGLPFGAVREAALALSDVGLLVETTDR
jgi:aminopeptidase-like protein